MGQLALLIMSVASLCCCGPVNCAFTGSVCTAQLAGFVPTAPNGQSHECQMWGALRVVYDGGPTDPLDILYSYPSAGWGMTTQYLIAAPRSYPSLNADTVIDFYDDGASPSSSRLMRWNFSDGSRLLHLYTGGFTEVELNFALDELLQFSNLNGRSVDNIFHRFGYDEFGAVREVPIGATDTFNGITSRLVGGALELLRGYVCESSAWGDCYFPSAPAGSTENDGPHVGRETWRKYNGAGLGFFANYWTQGAQSKIHFIPHLCAMTGIAVDSKLQLTAGANKEIATNIINSGGPCNEIMSWGCPGAANVTTLADGVPFLASSRRTGGSTWERYSC
jgi:hypothetical protein